MNTITKIAVILLSAFAFCSCVEKEEPIVYLDVNAHTISGSWQLVEWSGVSLNETTYMYVDFVRNDRTYTMYQNIDSFKDVPHKITGSYYLEVDPAIGAVIRGNYDHDSGDWAHRYIITDLTRSHMVWIAKDDPTFVQIWHRVDAIPVAE